MSYFENMRGNLQLFQWLDICHNNKVSKIQIVIFTLACCTSCQIGCENCQWHKLLLSELIPLWSDLINCAATQVTVTLYNYSINQILHMWGYDGGADVAGGTEFGNEPKAVVFNSTQLELTNFVLHSCVWAASSCVLDNMTNICHMLFILLSPPQRKEHVCWSISFLRELRSSNPILCVEIVPLSSLVFIISLNLEIWWNLDSWPSLEKLSLVVCE